MINNIPDVPIQKPKRSNLSSASFVWLIPFFALAIALGVAWQTYANQGRLIEVAFKNGAGIVANTTELRYREISVGVVEEVSLSDGLKAVVASIRLNKKIEPYVDENAQFWPVRPELTTQGISGLETVLSGVFIEGVWDGVVGDPASEYNGLSDAPLFHPGKPGLQIALRSSARGQLSDNSPIMFRGIEVGRIGEASIDPRGNFAIAEAIIYEPHDRLISLATRFWDISGFSVSIGASGASVDFKSLATLLSGGATFDTFVSGGGRVPDGTVFQIYADEDNARNSVFNRSDVKELTISAIFDDNISGLEIDSPVELRGFNIGYVAGVTGIIDPEVYGDERVRLNAVLAIQPTRLGLQDMASAEAALEFLTAQVELGLRARLASTGILTGGLKIELIEVDDATPAIVRKSAEGFPILPVTKSQISDASATVEGVLTRVNSLPVEELLNSAIGFLNAASSFVTDEDFRETPQDLRGLISDVRNVVATDDVQAVAGNLNKVLSQVETLLLDLEKEQVVQRLAKAIDAASNAMEGVDQSIEGVPKLIDEMTQVAVTARALPVTELITRLSTLSDSTNALLLTDGVQELPKKLSAALAEVNATLTELREGGAITNVNATLLSARDAADAVAVSTRDLPALVVRLTRVLEEASTTIKGYDKGATISRDAQSALRGVEKAAAAITSLARTLERNPSALLRGR